MREIPLEERALLTPRKSQTFSSKTPGQATSSATATADLFPIAARLTCMRHTSPYSLQIHLSPLQFVILPISSCGCHFLIFLTYPRVLQSTIFPPASPFTFGMLHPGAYVPSISNHKVSACFPRGYEHGSSMSRPLHYHLFNSMMSLPINHYACSKVRPCIVLVSAGVNLKSLRDLACLGSCCQKRARWVDPWSR